MQQMLVLAPKNLPSIVLDTTEPEKVTNVLGQLDPATMPSLHVRSFCREVFPVQIAQVK